MKVYVLDELFPGGIELVARHADVVRWDDPRVASWHEEADGLMVRLARITASDFARAEPRSAAQPRERRRDAACRGRHARDAGKELARGSGNPARRAERQDTRGPGRLSGRTSDVIDVR